VTVQWDIQDIILFTRKVRFRATSFRKIQWVELSPAIFFLSAKISHFTNEYFSRIENDSSTQCLSSQENVG